jgi:phosphoglycolate phosphatase-like HAD superfamily hydrolase
MKLSAANLDGYFPNGVGGFGDDRDARAELVPIAIERARKHYSIDGEVIPVVIGDSHRDVLAAKENGAVCVAVATGKLKSCELAGYQPEYIFEDFSDTSAVLKVFESI